MSVILMLRSIMNFITKNITNQQTVLKNTLWLLLAEWISRGSLSVLLIVIWRMFGKEVFGQYSYLNVILSFLIVFADLGISQLTIRDYQHLEQKHRRHYLYTGLRAKVLLSLAVTVLYCVILRFTASSGFLWLVGLLLLSNNITNSFLDYIRSTFRSLQKGEVELRIKLVQGLGNLLLIPVLCIFKSLAFNMIWQTLITCFTIYYARNLVQKDQLDEHSHKSLVTKSSLIQHGRAFAFSALFVSLYYYIDSLIIKRYWGYEKVGLYNAAYNLILLVIAPVAMLNRALMPNLRAKLKEASLVAYRLYLKRFTLWLLIASVPLFAWLLTFHKRILLSLYGSAYAWASSVFFILLISVRILRLYPVYVADMLASGRERLYMKITLGGLGFNIITNLILIPYDWQYAAITTLLTEALVLFVITIGRRRLPDTKESPHSHIAS